MDELYTCDCHCGLPMQLLTSAVYGKYWRCSCGTTHGAHPDGKPLGVPGDESTKRERINAHRLFDAIWRNALSEYVGPGRRTQKQLLKLARARTYAWLADRMGMAEEDCHFAKMSADQCKLAAEYCRSVTYSQVREWWKRRKCETALYTCDGCDRKNLAIGDDCTTNRVGACLCFDCLRMMDENRRALWDDAFSIQERVAEVLANG